MAEGDSDVDGHESSEAENGLRIGTTNVYLGPAVRFVLWAVDSGCDFVNPEFVARYCQLGRCRTVKERRAAELARKKRVKDAVLAADTHCVPIIMERFTGAEFGEYLNQMANAKTGEPLGLSAKKTTRSGVLWMLRGFQIDVPSAWASQVKALFKALKRVNAAPREDGLGELGKDELTLEMYATLCKAMLKVGHSMQFGHLMTILCWNLMARAGHVVDLLKEHVEWNGDHMRIVFAHRKTGQEGSTARYPRAVYANPLRPEICPVLAMGLYFMTFDMDSNEARLFVGGSQYNHYLSQLKKALEIAEVKSVLQAAGLAADDVASHANRKGAASFVMAESMSGPDVLHTSVRAGLSMPAMPNTHVFYSEAGDQLVGRTVCGLPFAKSLYAVLPPHFRSGADPVVLRALDLCFPKRSGSSAVLLSMCLASIVHHREFLRATLPVAHPLFASMLFVDKALLDSLIPLVTCGVDDPDGAMNATGIPPLTHALRAVEASVTAVNTVSGKLDSFLLAVVKTLKDALEKNALQAGSVTLPALGDALRDVVKETGLLELRDALRNGTLGGGGGGGGVGGVGGGGGVVVGAGEHDGHVGLRQAMQMHEWGGKLHRVPQSFKLPTGTPEQCFTVWLLGDAEHGYPPLRLLEPSDMPSRNDAKRLSDLRFLMGVLQTELAQHGAWIEDPAPQQVVTMYSRASHVLDIASKSPTGRARRPGQLSWKTVVNGLRRAPVAGAAVQVRQCRATRMRRARYVLTQRRRGRTPQKRTTRTSSMMTASMTMPAVIVNDAANGSSGSSSDSGDDAVEVGTRRRAAIQKRAGAGKKRERDNDS